MKKRPSDWEKLIKDYYSTNAYIERQKRKWLSPEEYQRRQDEERWKQASRKKSNG